MHSTCELRISSKTLSLSSIVDAVGATPTKGFDATDLLGRVNPRPRGFATAVFDSGLDAAEPLAELIEVCARFARSRRAAVEGLRDLGV